MNKLQLKKLEKYEYAFNQVTELLLKKVNKDNSQELNDMLEYFANKYLYDAIDDIKEWGQVRNLKDD
tara:strand:- start:5402 stop:5602 length:201 start_codon:yes stop_codon:yes gene_type:complete